MNENSISPAVLVVEDDPDDRLFLQAAAERSNLTAAIELFNTGSELVDYLTQAGGIDCTASAADGFIILVDAFPTGSSLSELVETIRSGGDGCKDLPILALIASEAEKDYINIHDLNLSGYLIKPVMEEDLSEIINRLA